MLKISKLTLSYPGCVVLQNFSAQPDKGLVLVRGGGGRDLGAQDDRRRLAQAEGQRGEQLDDREVEGVDGDRSQVCHKMRVVESIESLLLGALPPETVVYCAHEYTQSNGRYALVAEPNNADIAARMVQVDAARIKGEPTVPTTIALERATNPFMRAKDAAQLAERRAAKDAFR